MKTIPQYIPKKFKRIHLELTNRCNFSCTFCPDSKLTRERCFIDPDLAVSALDQIAELDLAEKITFHVMGEPLLHPNFFDILDHAGKIGLRVGLTTNGSLLTDRMISRLMERDLHQIDISLQTPDAESFNLTRGTKVDFHKYRESLLELLARSRSKPRPPIFKIRIMTTRFAGKMRNELGIPDFLGSSEELRRVIAEWTLAAYGKLNIRGDSDDILQRLKSIEIYKWNVIEICPETFIETYVLTDWGNAFGKKIVEADFGYCFGMRDHFGILCSGEVVLCCLDYDGKTGLGNLKDRSLLDILHSHELKRIMRGFRVGRLNHPHCRKCLGSSNYLSSLFKPTMSFLGLKLLKPFVYKQYRLFD